MKKWIVVTLALVLSGCSAHALKMMLTPAQLPEAHISRMQFDCTEAGLFIFEDFPDIVQSHPLTISSTSPIADLSCNAQ